MNMIAKNKITQKFISSILIILILAPSVFFLFKGEKAEALGEVPTNSIQANAFLKIITKEDTTTSITTVKSWVQKTLELALKIAAKQILARITQETINWINRDFHGSPLFLENPSAFFKDIAKSEIKTLVNMIGYDTFRFPFGKQTALNIIASYRSQLATNAQYTLSKVINDPDLLRKYRNDFNYGGWNGFLINTQYPQNNYLGFNMIIEQNLASRLEGTLQAPAQRVQSLLQQGMGFLSPQTCPSNPNYNNGKNEFVKPSFKPSKAPPNESEEDYYSRIRRETESWNDPHGENVCPGGLVNTTPGSVAANQIMTALNIPTQSKILDGAIGNSIAAILDALINKIVDKGLNALSSGISGGSSSSEDNWSYEGVTLGGGTTIGGGGATTISGLNVPSAVSVRAGETTTTTLSGGRGPYTATISNPALATVLVSCSGSSGCTLIVTGKTTVLTPLTPGTITITDSGTSCHKLDGTTLPDGTLNTTTVQGHCIATFPITVTPIGILAIGLPGIITTTNPLMYTISAVANETTTVTISGGDGNYSLQSGAGANQEVAMVAVGGDSLIVNAQKPGRIIIVIKDSSTPTFKTLPITIIVTTTATSSMIIPQNIKVVVGRDTNVGPITNGTGPYSATVANSTIASVTISNSGMLSIHGIKAGETQVDIIDSSIPDTKSGSTNVEVEPVEPLGTCVYTGIREPNRAYDTTVRDVTQRECYAFPTNNPQFRTWARGQ